METRCPAGAGQRQRSWLCAQHDSPVPAGKSPGVNGEITEKRQTGTITIARASPIQQHITETRSRRERRVAVMARPE
ncbi:hypothetical protein CRM76_00155 [Edwardsiella tarda]|uniref:Uncharacterized protein n=1 Tax=Edwardsiella tarda TaxID=636 RepID=A0A2A7U826_EDWTA|nr:hypothetical protein CRM76_00155 [Edwardsiella tarda]